MGVMGQAALPIAGAPPMLGPVDTETAMLPRILPVLALALAAAAAPAQAQLAQFCNGRVSLTNVTLDPRSVSDARRPWLYSGSLMNNTPGPLAVVLTYTGPSGVMSLANARGMTLYATQNTQVPLVQWPKSMGQPSLGTVAGGLRVECP
jgi:hypothetical protein